MKRIILATLIATILTAPTFAQDRTGGAPIRRPALTGNPIEDIKNAAGGGASQAAIRSSPLDKPFQDLADFIGDDIDAAINLSTSIPSLQDGNGQKCLLAFKTFGDVIKAHPGILTFKVATDLQAFRLKQMAVNRLCQEPACTVVFADITNTIQAAAAIPLPIPSLHDLCGKVPQIAVASPVALPVVTPGGLPVPQTPPARNGNP